MNKANNTPWGCQPTTPGDTAKPSTISPLASLCHGPQALLSRFYIGQALVGRRLFNNRTFSGPCTFDPPLKPIRMGISDGHYLSQSAI
jgi:hypothetical protein